MLDTLDEFLASRARHSAGRLECDARATLAASTLLVLGLLVCAAATLGLAASAIACSPIVLPALFQIGALRRATA